MGLAVSSSKYQEKKCSTLGEAIVEGKRYRTMEEIEKHADWVDECEKIIITLRKRMLLYSKR